MKIYLSADIEGACGTTNWDEVDKVHPDNAAFRDQMTAEVAAACQGALNAGAREIWVKDAHASGRNINGSMLPQEVRLIRGWSGHPYSMVQELDETFDAVIFIGYHARAGSEGNPLAHTMSSSKIDYLKINGRSASEFLLHAYIAAELKVPTVFLSGDEGICNEVRDINERIHTVAVKKGIGNSTVSIHPDLAVRRIRDGVEKALKGDIAGCLLAAPASYLVEIRFKKMTQAYRASFFPGVQLVDPQTIRLESDRYFDIVRMRSFVM
ncbi:MAG: M55 family metallopeptidase [Candidatus Neomarinimicrobiota bacterium]